MSQLNMHPSSYTLEFTPNLEPYTWVTTTGSRRSWRSPGSVRRRCRRCCTDRPRSCWGKGHPTRG